jgi:multiple sugar transport system permease protein
LLHAGLAAHAMKRFFAKLLVYALLLLGSAVFIIPLIWMISTGLKPIEQTMSMPPTWIPYRLVLRSDGVDQVVRVRETIETPSALVRIEESGERRVVAREFLDDGHTVWRDAQGGATRQAVAELQDIPAAPDRPWVIVASEAAPEAWTVVERAALTRRVAFQWGNFGRAIRAMQHFGQYLRNTLLLCLLTVIGTVLSSALAAYGFARIPWRGRNHVFALALATMMIPFPVVMVPIYSLFRWLGWIGTLRPLWVGSFCAGAFNVFLLRQFFLTIPKDLSEAARIDGCGEFRIFWQIILPLCKPALMVVGLFQFMATWNDFLGPLIYLTDQKDFTLALGLQFFQSQHGGTEWHYLMAASTLVALPIIVLFFFTQKSFIEGISMTGIKG